MFESSPPCGRDAINCNVISASPRIASTPRSSRHAPSNCCSALAGRERRTNGKRVRKASVQPSLLITSLLWHGEDAEGVASGIGDGPSVEQEPGGLKGDRI